jgi:hypothetical protein
MTALATFTLAAVATSIAPPAGGGGVEILTAQVQVEIVRPVIVRQQSGLQPDRDAPVPQISHRGRTILVEFQ